MKRKMTWILLILYMVSWTLPASALGGAVSGTDTGTEDGGAFYQYLLWLAGGDGTASLASTGEESAASALTGNDRIVYEMLEPEIGKIAAGERTSTVFTILPADLGADGAWSAADLGVPSIVEGSSISDAASGALVGKFSFDGGNVVEALLADHPFEMYWYDKTTGFSSNASYSFSARYEDGEYRILFGEGSQITMVFAVVGAYAGDEAVSTGTRTYPVELDTERLSLPRVQEAVRDARAVVEANAGKSDYEKLGAYKDAICERTGYDHAAADDDHTPYGEPWQLISVFDGDPDTNVVCEGYSKAFQYLCDLTEFAGPVQCYAATGTMAGGTGAGPHMWNVVHMDDGNNYLADVTNCDEGSIGAPDALFLKGVDRAPDGRTCTISIPDERMPDGIRGTITYTYDEDTVQLWGASGILSLSDTAYDPAHAGPGTDPGEDPGTDPDTPTPFEIREISVPDSGDGIVVEIAGGPGSGGILLVAAYGPGGKLLSVAVEDAGAPGRIPVDLDLDGAERVTASIVREADLGPIARADRSI